MTIAAAAHLTVLEITWAEKAIENGTCHGLRRQERRGETERTSTRQAKISKLHSSIARNKHAGGSNATVHDAVLAEIDHAKRVTTMRRRGRARGLHGTEQLRRCVEYKALVNDLAGALALLDDVGERTLGGK